MPEPLVVIGAGGFGREVLDVVDAINGQASEPVWQLVGVVDDRPSEENMRLLAARTVTYLGTLDELVDRGLGTFYAVGIGSPAVRRRVAARLDQAGLEAATLVHPTVTMGFDVTIGPGSVLCAGVRITTNIRIGRHAHINLNSTVGHDTTIGDYVSINPLASISGDCVIEDGVLIGVGGVVLNQVRVGAGATVGGCACVVKEVPSGAVVKGVPAR